MIHVAGWCLLTAVVISHFLLLQGICGLELSITVVAAPASHPKSTAPASHSESTPPAPTFACAAIATTSNCQDSSCYLHAYYQSSSISSVAPTAST